jgi:hypothetical protein
MKGLKGGLVLQKLTAIGKIHIFYFPRLIIEGSFTCLQRSFATLRIFSCAESVDLGRGPHYCR